MTMSEETSLNNSDYFETLVVLQFSPLTPAATKEWVIQRLTASQDEDDGAGLLARFDKDPESHVRVPSLLESVPCESPLQNNLLLIGASLHRLLVGAEELRIKKPYGTKGLREFLISDIDHFNNSRERVDLVPL